MKHTGYMMRQSFWVVILLLLEIPLLAQNNYDFCDHAYVIENPRKWCSKDLQFSTFEATNSGSDSGAAFANSSKDVWFKFVAIGDILKITVKGAGPVRNRMKEPEFILFEGDCDSQITMIGGAKSRKGTHFASLRKNEIIPGKTYLLTVQDGTMKSGGFKICVTNYSPKVVSSRGSIKTRMPELKKTVHSGAEFTLRDLHFDSNSAAIKSSFLPTLFEIVHFLKANPSVIIEIGGHTNSNCDDEYCQELSNKRAQSIARFLWSKKIPAQQITFHGYGKTKPRYLTKAKQSKNQRVTIKIVSI